MTSPADVPDQQVLRAEAATGEVVQVSASPVSARDSFRRSTIRRELAVLRDRVAALSRNPAAVATATVVTSLAVNAVREAVKEGALSGRSAPAPVAVTGYFISHVHVVHHVVHHVAHPGSVARPYPPALG